MLTISDKSKAILALELEQEKLFADSSTISDKVWVLHNKYLNDMQKYSLQQKAILDKIAAIEATKETIFKGD